MTVSSTGTALSSEPPYVVLVGKSTGGVPVGAWWSRNNELLSNTISHPHIRISEPVLNESSPLRYTHGLYFSTLTIIGKLLGTYEYTVTNRVTWPEKVGAIILEGTYL